MSEEKPKGLDRVPRKKDSSRMTTDILFGIDEILDVRIGAIAEHDSELASRILNSGRYHSRSYDEFVGLKDTEFQEIYQKRTADTLPFCLPTNVSIFLERVVKDALVADANSDGGDPLVFHFNTYPYDLLDEEIEMMLQAIRVYTLGYGEVKAVRYEIKDLTPAFLKANFDMVIMYDYGKLLTAHDGLFVKTPCPEVSFIVPMIYMGGKPTKEVILELSKIGHSPFEATRLALAKYLCLRIQPVSLFSITDRINPENKDMVLDKLSLTEENITEIIAKQDGTAVKPTEKEEPTKPEAPSSIEDDGYYLV